MSTTVPEKVRVPKFGILQRITGVLFRPGEVFRDVIEHPSYKTALFALIGVNIFFTALVIPKFIEHMHWSVQYGPMAEELSPAQIEAFHAMSPT
ncbi:MAG: hypothetical protein Q8N93_04335, partial [Bacillota bacterium]|nr:hypothetical protein [Bacillota bacterium]